MTNQPNAITKEEMLEKNREWKKNNPDKVARIAADYKARRKEIDKEYRHKNKDKRIRQNAEYRRRHPETAVNGSKKWREANKEKLVHYKVANEIEKGNMEKKSTCERCGSTENAIAHHHDYSRPLDVVWMCRVCHRKEHESSGEQARPDKGRKNPLLEAYEEILSNALIEVEPPGLSDLRGIAPDATGNLSSEEFVRRIREGWTPPWKPAQADEEREEAVEYIDVQIKTMKDQANFYGWQITSLDLQMLPKIRSLILTTPVAPVRVKGEVVKNMASKIVNGVLDGQGDAWVENWLDVLLDEKGVIVDGEEK